MAYPIVIIIQPLPNK